MKHRIRVGLLKAVPKSLDLDGNMALFERHLQAARGQGVELLITGESFLDGYAVLLKSCTRGYENQCYVCFSHPRMALIAGPAGEVVAKLQSSVPGVLVEDLDLRRAKEDNHLADRRPEL